MLLYQILAYTIHRNLSKNHAKNNKFKISAPMWNDKFELLEGSNSMSKIQDYFEFIIKKHEIVTAIYPPKRIYRIYKSSKQNRI